MSAVNPLFSIAVRLARWSELHEQLQHKIPFDHPACFKDYLASEVENGRAEICEILIAGAVVGFVVFRVEEFAQKELLVIAAYVGDHAVDYSTFLDGFFTELGRKLGCVSIRFHTKRAGLIHRAVTEGEGWRVADVILRKAIKP